jgi:hypothetical protein
MPSGRAGTWGSNIEDALGNFMGVPGGSVEKNILTAKKGLRRADMQHSGQEMILSLLAATIHSSPHTRS